jgi:hypothetical protein
MDAPLCRTCGTKHWDRICPGTGNTFAPPEPRALVTKPVTVTPVVTCACCERLRVEIAMLKRELALKTKPPMTTAERVRKHRAKKTTAGGYLQAASEGVA